jgi:hypothetical protein
MEIPPRKTPVKEFGTHQGTSPDRAEGFHKASRSYASELQGTLQTHRRRKKSRSTDSERVFGRRSWQIIPWYLWVGFSVLVVGVFFSTLAFYKFRARQDSLNAESPAKVMVVESPALPEVSEKWSGMQPREIAERFLAAKTHEERLKWVRQPELVAEAMREFFQNGPGKDEVVVKLEEMRQDLANPTIFARFQATLEGGASRLVFVPYETNGSGKVDFKCYARHGSETWGDLLSGRVTKAAEMRCILTVGTYYNQEFMDEKQWLSLMATTPDLEEILYFYVRRDDPDFSLFVAGPPTRPVRYTVAIESQGPSHEKRQFRLSKIHHSGWLGD